MAAHKLTDPVIRPQAQLGWASQLLQISKPWLLGLAIGG